MSDAKALTEIKRLAGLDRVILTKHARDRMNDRGARRGDVINALITATSATYEPERLNWRVVGGADRDGEALCVIVDLEADVIVVTLF